MRISIGITPSANAWNAEHRRPLQTPTLRPQTLRPQTLRLQRFPTTAKPNWRADNAVVDAQLLAIFGAYDSAVADADDHSPTASSSHCVSSNTCDRMGDQALLRAHSTALNVSMCPPPLPIPRGRPSYRMIPRSSSNLNLKRFPANISLPRRWDGGEVDSLISSLGCCRYTKCGCITSLECIFDHSATSRKLRPSASRLH